MTEGVDVLDALVDGVSIVELDEDDTSVGVGGLPNADGIIELDACCMDGASRRAGGVAALRGVAPAAVVAHRVLRETPHHLLAGDGALRFARDCGFEERDLTTERSRRVWREWKQRVDVHGEADPRRRIALGYRVALDLSREGLIEANHLWGTISCNGIGPDGRIAGVTTTSGLAFKMPGRVGDSPILGAGLYVGQDAGAAGSTGRGETNLYGLSSFLIVDLLRRGMSPKDAGIAALRAIVADTIDPALLNSRGEPNFNVKFYIVNAVGEYAGVALYGGAQVSFAMCTENGPELRLAEPLFEEREQFVD